jgi:hypothetical protein
MVVCCSTSGYTHCIVFWTGAYWCSDTRHSSQRIVELYQTLWTQLNNNEWLYVAPLVDTLTVVCSGQEPTDVQIRGTGKLMLLSMCKGYGSKVLIQAQVTITSNNTNKDIIPPLILDYDCCWSKESNIKFGPANEKCGQSSWWPKTSKLHSRGSRETHSEGRVKTETLQYRFSSPFFVLCRNDLLLLLLQMLPQTMP